MAPSISTLVLLSAAQVCLCMSTVFHREASTLLYLNKPSSGLVGDHLAILYLDADQLLALYGGVVHEEGEAVGPWGPVQLQTWQ
jgi:hypothetical protein